MRSCFLRPFTLSLVGVAIVSLGCGSTSESGSDSANMTQEIGYSCETTDFCPFETSKNGNSSEALGYCIQNIEVSAPLRSNASISIQRYSSVADEDYPELKQELSNFKRDESSMSGEWNNGKSLISAKLDDQTLLYAGTLVFEGGFEMDIQCSRHGDDPCARTKENGTYCGYNLTFEPELSSTLLTCENGATVTSEVCVDTCTQSIVDGVDGQDRCVN